MNDAKEFNISVQKKKKSPIKRQIKTEPVGKYKFTGCLTSVVTLMVEDSGLSVITLNNNNEYLNK